MDDWGLTEGALCADLKRLGLAAGDVVIVHASMKSLGRVRGGPATVIRALQRTVTRRGVVMMPTFSYNFEKVYAPTEPFRRDTSPSQTGLLSETFRRSPDVVRSGHPTHSVAAWGRGAEDLTRGHEDLSGLAEDSPFHRAARRGAKACLIGCDFTAFSLVHVAEEIAHAPYLSLFIWAHAGWKPTARIAESDGRERSVAYASVPGCSRSYGTAQRLLAREGMVRTGRIGSADALLVEAAPLLERLAAELHRRPDFLLCPQGTCRACDERRVVLEQLSPPASALRAFMVHVIGQAGVRLAGSEGEDRAAEIVSERMTAMGLDNVAVHRFPIRAWRPGFSALQVFVNDAWQDGPSAPVAHSPATRGRGVCGEAVQIEAFSELASLSGKGPRIAVLWDGYGESLADFRRLMDAGFDAFLLVDKRFHHSDVVAEGVPAQWIPAFTKPMVSLPQPHAFQLFGRGPVRCRLRVTGKTKPGLSSVVTGEIPGRGRGVILMCGHHDSTFNSVAPDDNLAGVGMALVAAARLLKRRRPRCTIRFCSFGSEEQLSEGARWYAFESGLARDVRFVLNNDSVGARCGVTDVFVSGAPALARWVRARARAAGIQIKFREELCPFSDQFPFNCLGAPSLWFHRQTLASGVHYHHTVRGGLSDLSFEYMARMAAFQADLLARAAGGEAFPFPSRLPAATARAAARMRRDWYTP